MLEGVTPSGGWGLYFCPCPRATVLRQGRKGRSPLVSQLLKDEEGPVSFSWGRGPVSVVLSIHIHCEAQSCGLWGQGPAPPSEDPRLPAGLKFGGQQVKTQALDTPLSLLLWARAAATVLTQRVQTHPVCPAQVGAWATPWHEATPSVFWAPGLVQLGGSVAKVYRLTWTGGCGVNCSPWEQSRSVHQSEPPSPPGVDRGHLSRAVGLVEARRTSGVPPLPPRAGWRLDLAEPSSWSTIIPDSLGVLQEPPEKSFGEWGGLPASRTKRKTQPPWAWPARIAHLPCATCGALGGVSVRSHGLEGVWRPGGLALTEGRAGLRAHPCPQPDTAQGKHGPRGDLELVS